MLKIKGQEPPTFHTLSMRRLRSNLKFLCYFFKWKIQV